MSRLFVLGSAVLLVAMFPVPAMSEEDPIVTWYLQGSSVGNLDTAVEFAADTWNSLGSPATIIAGAPHMGPEVPTSETSSVAATDSLGNDQFRKNFLLMYWEGSTAGRVYDAEARIFVQTPAAIELTATIFGDGGIGSGNPFSTVTIPVAANGAPALVTIDFGDAAANVEESVVLQLYATEPETGAGAAAIFYNSIQHPSALSFRLTDPITPPPREWIPEAGWGAVHVINDTAAHRETSLALSPTDASLMIACAPSGVPNTQNGQSYFHVSRDGGDTWSSMSVETDDNDQRKKAFEGGDCDVTFDQSGVMYSADTWLGSLSVGHSFDGGLTWTGTALAASSPIVDRPWLVGGPAGTIHVLYHDLQCCMPGAIWYTRSTDFGLTFLPAVSVTTGASAEGSFSWTGNLVVSEDGEDLYSIYTRRGGPAVGDLDDMGPESVWLAASHDGGITWTQNLVARMPNPASYLYPSLARDEAGGLHAVFSSMTDVDRPIWYAHSEDDGLTWSAPEKVLAGVAGWSPWIVPAGPGDAAIAWYGTKDALGNTSAEFDWYFFTARVTDHQVVSAGATTTTPIFTGVQSAIPEFNELRLDGDGKIHVGASAFLTVDGGTGWALFHQREI